MNVETRQYLAQIGSRGGKKSRRGLSPEQARRMVAVREAQKAYDAHRHEYFWSYRDNVKITAEDVDWVVQGLMNEGDRAAFEKARSIRRLIRGN
ncbi:MAG: hypothetical protein AAF571_15455 [Verrucomicrobiota bacterium]